MLLSLLPSSSWHAPLAQVIDEIGTEDEALAARSISQRGIQLIATAHGEGEFRRLCNILALGLFSRTCPLCLQKARRCLRIIKVLCAMLVSDAR